MRQDNIVKLVEELMGAVKRNVELPSSDKEDVKNYIKEVMTNAFKEADFVGMLRDLIEESMEDVKISRPKYIDETVVRAKIVTETRESQEVNEKMRALSESVAKLSQEIKAFNYEGRLNDAIKGATKDIHLTNAIVTDKQLINYTVREEEKIIPLYKEELRINEIHKDVPVHRIREEYVKVQKLVFPDGSEFTGRNGK